MTSKTLFFNLTKQELKSKLWLIALTEFLLFCVLPLNMAMNLSRITKLNIVEDEITDRLLSNILNTSSNSFFLIICVIGLGLVIGISMFSYLFSKNKVDTYHCLPVSRNLFFGIKAFTGFLIFFSAYLLQYLFMIIICVCYRAPLKELSTTFVYLFFLHLLGFLVSYLIASICAILSGQLVVSGILYGMVLLLPFESLFMISFYSGEYFDTYFDHYENLKLIRIREFISPLFLYTNRTQDLEPFETGIKGFHPVSILYLLLIVAILSLVALFLYKKRPSEAASNALAFRQSRTPIRLIAMLMASMLSSIFFRQSSNVNTRLFWTIFGFAFGLILSFILANAIIHSDFRKALCKPIELIIAGIVVALFFCSFLFDFYSFDTFLPKKDKLASVGINVSGLVDYHQLRIQSKFQNTDYSLTSNEVNIIEKLELDPEKYYDFLVNLIQTQESESTKEFLETNAYVIYDKVPETSIANDSPLLHYVYVRYQYKNGKEAYRQYRIRLNDINKEKLYALYDDPAYREITYPILSIENSSVDSLYVSDNNLDGFLPLNLSQKEKENLFATLKAYLLTQQADTLTKSLPVGRLVINYQNKETNGILSQTYYLYPEYTQVISFLTDHGASFTKDVSKIKRIAITQSEDFSKEFYHAVATEMKTLPTNFSEELVYTKQEEIAQIMEAACLSDYVPDTFLKPIICNINCTIVSSIDEYGNEIYRDYSLRYDQLPSFVIDDINEQLANAPWN